MRRFIEIIIFLPAFVFWLPFVALFQIACLLTGKPWGFTWKTFDTQVFLSHDGTRFTTKDLALLWKWKRN